LQDGLLFPQPYDGVRAGDVLHRDFDLTPAARSRTPVMQEAARTTSIPTAAVIADSAPASALLPRSASMYGAPTNIQRKQGVKVTHVASNPPSIGDSPAGLAERRSFSVGPLAVPMSPDNLSDEIEV
jgi:hypothetical protein